MKITPAQKQQRIGTISAMNRQTPRSQKGPGRQQPAELVDTLITSFQGAVRLALGKATVRDDDEIGLAAEIVQAKLCSNAAFARAANATQASVAAWTAR
jgi:hypothetical protein